MWMREGGGFSRRSSRRLSPALYASDWRGRRARWFAGGCDRGLAGRFVAECRSARLARRRRRNRPCIGGVLRPPQGGAVARVAAFAADSNPLAIAALVAVTGREAFTCLP